MRRCGPSSPAAPRGSALKPAQKKSRSTVNSPIFACKSRIVDSCSDCRDTLPLANISSKPSTACRFHWLTWFGCTSCRAAISCIVRSPRKDSSATRFLNSAVNRRLRLVAIPVPPKALEYTLSDCPKIRNHLCTCCCRFR